MRGESAQPRSISGVSLESYHEAGGIVQLSVKVEVGPGLWVEIIRTPYADDGVISHHVYAPGIEACINRALADSVPSFNGYDGGEA